MAERNEPTEQELKAVKQKLLAGKLETRDLEILKGIVERTEIAAKQLRAAVVE